MRRSAYFLPPFRKEMTLDNILESGCHVGGSVAAGPARMHNEEFTKMAAAGLSSHLRNLDKRFQSRTWPECPSPVAAP